MNTIPDLLWKIIDYLALVLFAMVGWFFKTILNRIRESENMVAELRAKLEKTEKGFEEIKERFEEHEDRVDKQIERAKFPIVENQRIIIKMLEDLKNK